MTMESFVVSNKLDAESGSAIRKSLDTASALLCSFYGYSKNIL